MEIDAEPEAKADADPLTPLFCMEDMDMLDIILDTLMDILDAEPKAKASHYLLFGEYGYGDITLDILNMNLLDMQTVDKLQRPKTRSCN